MLRVAIGMLVGGVVLMFLGWQELQLGAGASAQPQEITAQELITHGYGDNPHVRVSGLVMFSDMFVYESPAGQRRDYRRVWLPAAAPGDLVTVKELDPVQQVGNMKGAMLEVQHNPTGFELIVVSREPTNDYEVLSLVNQTTVQGMVINKIDKLDGEELKLLRTEFPSIDPDKVLILEHNRKPAGGGKVLGYFGGGIALLLLGPGALLMGMAGGGSKE